VFFNSLLEGMGTERIQVKLNRTDTDVGNGNGYGLLLHGGGGENGAGRTGIKECVMKMVRGVV
jgi:hypothetical protein